MKIFISWSGDLSKAVALAFRDWLKLFFTRSEPFMSDEDIEKGTRGLDAIALQLDTSTVGLFCITKENLERPWINYEAGAIAREVGRGRVLPFLINLTKGDVPQHSPLTQFQMTLNDKEDIHKMLRSISHASDPPLLDDLVLNRYIEVFWDDLKTKIDVAFQQDEQKVGRQASTTGAMVAEILDIVRALQRQRSNITVIDGVRISDAHLGLGQEAALADLLALGRLTPRTGAVARVIPVFLKSLQETLGRMPTAEEIVDAMVDNPLTKHLVSNGVTKEQALLRARAAVDPNTGAIGCVPRVLYIG